MATRDWVLPAGLMPRTFDLHHVADSQELAIRGECCRLSQPRLDCCHRPEAAGGILLKRTFIVLHERHVRSMKGLADMLYNPAI